MVISKKIEYYLRDNTSNGKQQEDGISSLACFVSFSTMSSQDLFGVVQTDGTFYQGILPVSPTSTNDWIKSAKVIGESGWNSSNLDNLLFHPDGTLYGMFLEDPSGPAFDSFYKAAPPNYRQQLSFGGWLKNAKRINSLPMEIFSSSFFDPDGKLYFVYDDQLSTMPPGSTKWQTGNNETAPAK